VRNWVVRRRSWVVLGTLSVSHSPPRKIPPYKPPCSSNTLVFDFLGVTVVGTLVHWMI